MAARALAAALAAWGGAQLARGKRAVPPHFASEDVGKTELHGDILTLPNGTAVTVTRDESGAFVFPNGDKIAPFDGLTPEPLTPDSLGCADGRLSAVFLPPVETEEEKAAPVKAAGNPKKAAKNSKKVRSAKKTRIQRKAVAAAAAAKVLDFQVRRTPMPNMEPVELYVDLSDDHNQFLLFPPTAHVSAEWRLMYRRASSIRRREAWVEQRLFKLGSRHPCDLPKKPKSPPRTPVRGRQPPPPPRPTLAGGRGPPLDDVRVDPLPLATATLKALVAERWHPSGWSGSTERWQQGAEAGEEPEGPLAFDQNFWEDTLPQAEGEWVE